MRPSPESPHLPEIELVQVMPEAALAITQGATPPGLKVPDDYPTEFSMGIAQAVGNDGQVGPFFVRRRDDGVIVGEIGGAFIDPSTVEIGYAVVASQAGRGYATAAVIAFVANAEHHLAGARRIIAHAPLDRPASSRVLSKAGFANRGQVEDEHEGESLAVEEWELVLT